jgi:hypothetical protein
MDVATIVITASLIIILLQVVSIVLIVKNKKSVVVSQAAPPVQPAQSSYDQRDFRKRREDNRFTRKPGFEQKPRPVAPQQQPPQAVDYVEKSLRDINLKLKNAERDQENARKKIRDVIQSPAQGQGQNQNQPRRFDNSQNRPSRPRDDDFRRRDRQGRPGNAGNNQFRDRDRNSDQNRPPEMERPFVEQASPTSPPVSTPVSVPIRDAVQPQPIIPAPVQQPVQPVVEKEVISVAPENTEIFHGRKVLVRRRILTPEEQAAKDRESASPASSVPQAAAGEATSPRPPSAESKPAEPESSNPPAIEIDAEPIRFGR